ncbi:MAG: adenylate/guanylate cyclase domain-containing protein [Pseudomonadota bacterium]
MAGYETHRHAWTWHFDSPAERIWPLLSDTARFNEAAELPKQEIEEQPQADGSVLYLARAKMGPFALRWREIPVNWVANRWFEHRREFLQGPLADLTARFELTPEGEGCRGDYQVEATAANLLGEMILRTSFFKGTGRTFSRLAETAGACAQGLRDTAFDYRPPAPAQGVDARLDALVARVEASGHGHGLATRLAKHLMSAQEVDLAQIRPLALARWWGVPVLQTVELCLEATRAGMLELQWTLLCPRCRIAKAAVSALDELPQGAHCGTCNIDYGRDFSQNVELSFQPATGLRPIVFGEYCLFGPQSTPHIPIHVTLQPGERRVVQVAMPPGAYRLRTLEAGPELDIEVDEDRFPEVVAESEDMAAGPPAPPGEVALVNDTPRLRTLIVEERRWVRDALTADRVTSLQAFRDLFSDQVLRPGDEVAVRRVALMFTDLSDSTALYGAIGDASAYHLVRDHFAFLAAIVRRHEGAIIKTIGDAIMAAFALPDHALAAALEIQQQVAAFNRDHAEAPIAIKLGLHLGPCIAVTLNERLDYFGTTVNLAARLQSQSRGGDIVISGEMAEEPEVAQRLTGLELSREQAALKGFDVPVGFVRLEVGSA